MLKKLLDYRLQIILVHLRERWLNINAGEPVEELTIAESRSKARIRILISWSLTLARIRDSYSAIKCGCEGTIFARASKEMYFTKKGIK